LWYWCSLAFPSCHKSQEDYLCRESEGCLQVNQICEGSTSCPLSWNSSRSCSQKIEEEIRLTGERAVPVQTCLGEDVQPRSPRHRLARVPSLRAPFSTETGCLAIASPAPQAVATQASPLPAAALQAAPSPPVALQASPSSVPAPVASPALVSTPRVPPSPSPFPIPMVTPSPAPAAPVLPQAPSPAPGFDPLLTTPLNPVAPRNPGFQADADLV
jgi:hypothetical protein